MLETIASALDELWQQEKPFVFFRLPNADKIHLYYQEDKVLHLTKDLTEAGFVFAPFEKKEYLAYIPAKHKADYLIPSFQASSRVQNLEEPEADQLHFIDLVERAQKVIKNEKLSKLVVSRPVTIPFGGSFASVFLRLIDLYPNALVYLWNHPKVGVWLGASPEMLLTQKGTTFHTMALAATQPKNETGQYKWSAKEIKEQALVTTQIKEDLSLYFSVSQLKVSKPYTKEAGNLVHLCTDLMGEQASMSLRKVVDVLHPTPAVGGIPKDKAIQFIQQEEGYARTYYTGFLGPFSSHSTQLFVNLRCASYQEKALTLFVGAGITSESNPQKEWEETQHKAQTLQAAL